MSSPDPREFKNDGWDRTLMQDGVVLWTRNGCYSPAHVDSRAYGDNWRCTINRDGTVSWEPNKAYACSGGEYASEPTGYIHPGAEQQRYIDEWNAEHPGGVMRYNHKAAEVWPDPPEHKLLLQGQSVSEISMEELRSEYQWALTNGGAEYAKKLRSLIEYKITVEAFRQKYAKNSEPVVLEEVKPVNKHRVGDEHRNRVSDHLSNLYQQGYIDLNEFETLNDKALAAKTVDDLAGLLTDLPPMPDTPPAYNPSPALLPAQRGWLRQWLDHPVSAVFVMVSGTAFVALAAILVAWLTAVV